MIRSYLGKAYFEEKRDDMTEREYKNAKELDPKDPTPFFYDALQKQLTNRPIEALQDMEQAINLIKSAPYIGAVSDGFGRCRPQLSLGRIYTNLGFQHTRLWWKDGHLWTPTPRALPPTASWLIPMLIFRTKRSPGSANSSVPVTPAHQHHADPA